MKSLILLVFLTISPLGFALQNDATAPPFSTALLSNNEVVSLSQFRGKVLYIDFWASWCPPCRKAMPQLNKLRKDYAGQGFEVLAINMDEEASDAHQFLDEVRVDYPVAYDPDGQVATLYDVMGLPQAFIVGKDGKIKYVHQGFRKGDIEIIRQIVEKLTAYEE